MFTEIEKVKEEAKEARTLAIRASTIASDEKKKVNSFIRKLKRSKRRAFDKGRRTKGKTEQSAKRIVSSRGREIADLRLIAESIAELAVEVAIAADKSEIAAEDATKATTVKTVKTLAKVAREAKQEAKEAAREQELYQSMIGDICPDWSSEWDAFRPIFSTRGAVKVFIETQSLGHPLIKSSSRTQGIHNLCGAVGSGAVYFYVLGLSRAESEPESPACKKL